MDIKVCTVKFIFRGTFNSKFVSCRGLTSSACLRKVLFSTFAHSMHSRQSSTSWPVAASMSRKRSSKERTSRAALALEMEFRKGRTYFNRPPSSARIRDEKEHLKMNLHGSDYWTRGQAVTFHWSDYWIARGIIYSFKMPICVTSHIFLNVK